MPVPTKVRTFNAQQLLACFQSAKGTIAADFTVAGAAGLWTVAARLPVSPEQPDDSWMTEDSVEASASLYNVAEDLRGAVICHGTPTSVEWLLRSNYGAFSGGTFTLAAQVAATQWLTLAYVENVLSGATEKLIRLRDAWFHRLQFSVRKSGLLALRGDFAARACTPTALDAGGVTLPASPMSVADKNVFVNSTYVFTRDPASAAVQLRVSELDLVLDQGLYHEWDMMAGLYEVHKTGKLRASLRFEAEVADESWVVLTNARAGTNQRFRVVLTAPSPAKTLTFDFYEMRFRFEPIGHDENRQVTRFRASAEAHKTGSTFLTITMA